MLRQDQSRPLRLATLVVLTAAAAACGGGDGGGGITPPPTDTTCAHNPTQPRCQTTPTTTGPLKTVAAAASGRIFGTALDASFTATNSAKYDSVVAAEFSGITPGNVMKWSSISLNGRFSYRWQWPDSMVAFAQKNGMKVHGHTLAWHNQNPTWLYQLGATASADTMRRVLLEHVDSVVGHFKGKVYAWDVVNEAVNDNGALRDTVWGRWVGRTYIDSAFARARKADPGALLFYNDYNIETPGAKQDSVFAMVSRLKAAGNIDGVGFQAHLLVTAGGGGTASRATYQASMERFAALGIKVELTELDVRIPDTGGTTELTAQQQAYTNIVGACKAVTACDAIIVWGVNDGESWVPSTFPGYGRALLFTDAFGHKDTYNAVTAALK